MATWKQSERAREALDSRVAHQNLEAVLARPQSGWIRSVRDAIRMTAAELGNRIGVAGAAVRAAEQRELAGSIQISTLRRAAEAMGCTFVYGFVPISSLQDIVELRAEAVLERDLKQSAQTMALEDQAGQILEADRRALIEDIIRSGDIWSGD